jgi:hypothetical protein
MRKPDRAITARRFSFGGGHQPADATSFRGVVRRSPVTLGGGFGHVVSHQESVTHRTLGENETMTRRAVGREFLDRTHVRNARQVIPRLPQPMEYFEFMSNQNFTTHAALTVLMEMCDPEVVRDMWIATLSFTEKTILDLCRLHDEGRVERISVICSVYFEAKEREKFHKAKQLMSGRNMRLVACLSHAKIALLDVRDAYILTGSGNLRSCSSIEQYTLTAGRDLYAPYAKKLEQFFQ